MIKLGYKASAEQFAPGKLLDFSCLAEEVGFDLGLHQRSLPAMEACRRPRAILARRGWARSGARTSRVVMGTSVLTPTFRYHPSIVAQAFGTLGAMFPGRVILGIGTGEVAQRGAVDRQRLAGVEGALRPPARSRRP